jgi:hypothetical protein
MSSLPAGGLIRPTRSRGTILRCVSGDHLLDVSHGTSLRLINALEGRTLRDDNVAASSLRPACRRSYTPWPLEKQIKAIEPCAVAAVISPSSIVNVEGVMRRRGRDGQSRANEQRPEGATGDEVATQRR